MGRCRANSTPPLVVGVIAIAIVVMLVSLLYPYGTQFDRTITVKSRTEAISTDGNVKLIQTTDNDWYTVSDSPSHWQFNSRDVWGSMEQGKTYTVHGYGWRFGPASVYPNIVRVESKD